MSTLAIIQARMGSTRFPGKVLQQIDGKAILLHIVERLSAVPSIEEIVLAIPEGAADQPLRAFCREQRISFWSGSETDVLDRYYGTARRYGGDPILRITADCPLVDPGIVEDLIRMYRTGHFDYVAVAAGADSEGLTEGRFPDGLDAECCSFAALEAAWLDATDARDREHVTRFLWKNKKRFRCGKLFADAHCPSFRLTVDHPLDLKLVRRIYAELGDGGKIFPVAEVIGLMERKPELAEINRHLIEAQNYRAVAED
jgi:spore coat polysaccharide biosynthesis protein SpsF (cytidylyltransferase family)